jgi:hypothetical protein
MNLNPFSFLQNRRSQADRRRTQNERLQQYARLMRAYQGFSVRGVTDTSRVHSWKRVKFNFNAPVVNLSAGWFAAKPIDWEIQNDPEATEAAYAIWSRSGSDAVLLENAKCCGIYGEVVGIATQDSAGLPKIEFVDPSITTPTFDGSDCSKLASLEIAYEQLDAQGDPVTRREMWMPGGMEVYEGDTLVDTRPYDQFPAQWIKNASVKGLPFGTSDIEPILELVEEYDHLASKQTRIVDYYASPNIVFKGLQKEDRKEKGVGTVFFLPADGDAKFLEWSGSGPDVELQLTRIRNAIAEISQVPAVAFGQADSGLTSISGVAIQILYGPLLSKTHGKQACWGPCLEYLMWRCLVAAGFKSLTREQVKVKFPNATPVDGQAQTAEGSAKIAARVSSRRTVMNDLGIENPDSELKRIVIEDKILQLATPKPTLSQDANTAAAVGGKGGFAGQKPDQGAAAPAEPMAGGTGSTEAALVDDVATMIAQIDALLEAENANLEASEGTGKSDDKENT